MNRNELIKDMQQFCGSRLITRKKLADYYGKKDPHGIDHILEPLNAVESRYYFIPDVADSILNNCKWR